MDLREAATRAPAWERRIYRAFGLEDEDDVAQAITWYEELARETAHPGVDVHLAILEGEAGRLDALRRRLDGWAPRQEPLPSLDALVRAAYLPGVAPPPPDVRLDDEAADLLPAGWFRDRLEIALATRGGDADGARPAAARLAARSDAALRRARLAIGTQLLAAVVGGGVLVILLCRGRPPLLSAVGTASIPPPWPAADGVAVLLRGGALGVVVMVGALGWGLLRSDRLLGATDVLIGGVMALPVLLLAARRLFRPWGLGARAGFGLGVAAGGGRRLVQVIPVVIALVLVGDWAIGAAAGLAGASGHWTEWFDEDLVFGGRAAMTATLAGAVVLAPLSEELTFRGILFVTLRHRLAWPAAAALSAMAFAALHGYGVAGFLSVWWSGFVWSWAYERTHSLWPAVAGHAAANLFATLLVVGVLR